MPEKIIILCPHHGGEEELTIPDSYIGAAYSHDKAAIFDGDMLCNPKSSDDIPRKLRLRIHFQGGKAPWVESVTM